MSMRLSVLLLIGVLSGFVELASAQSTAVATATETYVCPQCGKMHARATGSGEVVRTTATTSATSGRESNVGTAVMPRVSNGVTNVLDALNGQRARQGLRSLRYDPQLQAVAERRAARMAASGQKGHPSGSFAPGRYEGVGWSSSYSPSGVSACYTSDSRMQYAGAAMASGRDGVYFTVVYR